MTQILAFDLETIPRQDLPVDLLPQFDESEVKTGGMGAEKAQEKINNARKEWAAKINKTMSLDPAYAQLCAWVGIIYDTEKEEVITEQVANLTAEDEHDDLELVVGAWSLIQSAYQQRIPLVTFNGQQFDLQVLFMRAILQDVRIDRVMFRRLTQRYGSPFHYDIMQILSGWDRQRWHSFDFYMRLFGAGDKLDFDGGDVYPAYQKGEFDKIKDYCRSEVLAMCQIFTRVEHWIKLDMKEGA